jgi:1,4-dihydroxy-2-naphthoate octaprenyltransferase
VSVSLNQFLQIVEIRTKIVSVSGFLIGTLFAAVQLGSFSLAVALLLLAAVLAVDMATTAFNSFFDHVSGVDRRDRNHERDKVLLHEDVPAGVALVVALALILVAMVLGILLAWLVGGWIIVVGAVSMVVGFLYNAGPVPISRTPFGEFFAGGFLGWLLVILAALVHVAAAAPNESFLTALRQHEALTIPHLLEVGLPSFFMVASILTVNNTCDMDGDRRSGRRTLSIVMGHQTSRALVPLLGAIGFSYAAWLAWRTVLPLVVLPTLLLAALWTVPRYLEMDRRGYSHATKGPSMGTIARIFRLFSGGIVAGLLLSALGVHLPLGG